MAGGKAHRTDAVVSGYPPLDQLPHDAYIVLQMCEGYRNRSEEDFLRLRDRYGVRLAIVEGDHRGPSLP